jgi:hypothetical protein
LDEAARIRRREEAKRRLRRRRRIVSFGVALVGVAVLALLLTGSTPAPSHRAKAASKPPPPPSLPRGGRVIFPGNRVVAYYGAPQDPQLGELGIGTPAHAGAKLERQARGYRRGRVPVLPAFELITTVASGAPGTTGRFSYRSPRSVIDRYLRAARKAKALLILDIQPGRIDWMTDVVALRPYLEQPDVSLALDPEWKVQAGEIPGKVIGSTDATDVNRVSAYLAAIVRERGLPQKLLVVHQFTDNMIRNKQLLEQPAGVALTLNVDGFGDQPNKVAKYRGFTHGPAAPHFHRGFKLFYHEDTRLMSPRQVLRLRPRPELVVYE